MNEETTIVLMQYIPRVQSFATLPDSPTMEDFIQNYGVQEPNKKGKCAQPCEACANEKTE